MMSRTNIIFSLHVPVACQTRDAMGNPRADPRVKPEGHPEDFPWHPKTGRGGIISCHI